MKKLTHVDSQGNARMVDIGDKQDQHRYAKAQGSIIVSAETLELVKDNSIKKGDVLTTAEIAGIQAAKRTSLLIPLCHTINLEKIMVKATPDTSSIIVECEVNCTGKTGVEMEALTGVSIALLTIYDMCKAVDKNMVITEIKLVEKIKRD